MRNALLALVVATAVGLAGFWLWASFEVGRIVETASNIFVTPAPVRPGSNGGAGGTPVPVTFPDWGKEPVNILLIGLDYRPGDAEGTRADTQIVVHIDPVAKTATLLSIPRDLWVRIPGHGEDRINVAYRVGEQNKAQIPGGGPVMAMATIEQNFGIPIHYFAQVDFMGFERVVDALGGITIDVPRPLVDNEYPLSNYGVTRIYIQAGLQHMDGRTALQYARSRHADSDLGRNRRQQQVLLAIRRQALNINVVTRLNELAGKLSDAVKTDLSPQQVGSLAMLGREIGQESIHSIVLEPPCVNQTVLPSGADVLLPDWDCIRPKVAQAFANPRIVEEAARISVQNGTLTGGVGRKVRDELVAKGFSIADLSSAPDQGNHPVTTIIDFTGGQKPHTVQALAKALGIDPGEVKQANPEDAPIATSDGKPVDILVMVGDDRIDK
jgi:LCP family protein required for cell wall assembly